MSHDYVRKRFRMVEQQLVARDITDENVLNAFRNVPRHLFVPDEQVDFAYADGPLPTMSKQTISQPYIVALMTQLLDLPEHEHALILEVGTGSGYQAAILAYLGHHVISLERLPELAEYARKNLSRVPYGDRVTVLESDGSLGWPAYAPYDRIIVTAAAPHVPTALVRELRIGGRLVIPCGSRASQYLDIVTRCSETVSRTEHSIACCFVPLLGEDAFLSAMPGW